MCILSSFIQLLLRNILRKALDEIQNAIKADEENINDIRYADYTLENLQELIKFL